MSIPAVPRFHPHDFAFESGTEHLNPFYVELDADFIHESGARIDRVPGFHDGGQTWILRFSPNLEGRWRAATRSSDPAMDGLSLALECVPNENDAVHGLLRIDPNAPRRFAFEDGTEFVPLGFECDWLFALHQSSPEQARELIRLIAERGFNYVVTNVYAHTGFSEIGAPHVYGPPSLYTFGGTNDAPDHSILNPAFFQDFDETIRLLFERGIAAHLMIQVQNKRVNWPERRSSEDDLFWRHVVSRYQAFGNVVWDIGKESYNYARKFDDPDYILDRMAFIRRHDAYRHLVTVHDELPNSSAKEGPGDLAADFVSDQIHLADADAYNRETIRRFRTLDKPYMNIEYGYELGAEAIQTYHSGTSRRWEDVLVWTYAILLGGGYPCYYYNNTAWDLIKFDPEPEGWKRCQFLAEFLRPIRFAPMVPDNEYVDRGFCLAEQGRQYLIFLPEGGNVRLDATAVPKSGLLSVEWMDAFTGERDSAQIEERGFLTKLENPLANRENPCVLYLARHRGLELEFIEEAAATHPAEEAVPVTMD